MGKSRQEALRSRAEKMETESTTFRAIGFFTCMNFSIWGLGGRVGVGGAGKGASRRRLGCGEACRERKVRKAEEEQGEQK